MMITSKVTVCLMMTFSTLTSSAIGTTDTQQRSRRSNNQYNDDKSVDDYSNEQSAGYRFGDEFFNHPSAETAEATETEISHASKSQRQKDAADGCERVIKDSMICMICKDPKTNSNYEQCSYVTKPKDRGQSYSNSRSYTGTPAANIRNYDENQNEEEKEDDKPYDRYNTENNDEEDDEDDEKSEKYSEDDDDDDEDSEKYEERESSPTSPLLTRTNVGYGGNEENDRKNSGNGREDYHVKQPSNYNERLGQSNYGSARNPPASHSKLKTSENSEESQNDDSPKLRTGQKSNKKRCHEVQKDSMTCTICTDPENGGNFEKCSYTHQPNDKLYKFSKSKRFGYPHEEADDERTSPEETKRVTDVVIDPTVTTINTRTKHPRCRKIRKDSSTVCTVCKDTKTGDRSEQCEYNLKVEPTTRRISRTIASPAAAAAASSSRS